MLSFLWNIWYVILDKSSSFLLSGQIDWCSHDDYKHLPLTEGTVDAAMYRAVAIDYNVQTEKLHHNYLIPTTDVSKYRYHLCMPVCKSK